MFQLPVFGVKDSMTFPLMCVHIILVQFRLLSGHEFLKTSEIAENGMYKPLHISLICM